MTSKKSPGRSKPPQKGRGPRRRPRDKAAQVAAAFEKEARQSAISRIRSLEEQVASLSAQLGIDDLARRGLSEAFHKIDLLELAAEPKAGSWLAQQREAQHQKIDSLSKTIDGVLARLATIEQIVACLNPSVEQCDRDSHRVWDAIRQIQKDLYFGPLGFQPPRSEQEAQQRVVVWAQDWKHNGIHSSIHVNLERRRRFIANSPGDYVHVGQEYEITVDARVYEEMLKHDGMRIARCKPATPEELSAARRI